MDKSWVVEPSGFAAVELREGQELRIIQIEGGQVVDLNCFNLDNFREHFSASKTRRYNGREIKKAYSDAPYENVMLKVIEDTVGVHDLYCDRCSERMYELIYGVYGHKNCQSNLAQAIAPYGLGPDAVHDTLNLFMNVRLAPDGRVEILSPTAKAGDRIVFQASMDCLVALSVCPADLSPCNDLRIKPIRLVLAT